MKPEGNCASTPRADTLVGVISQSINKAQFGYHELTIAEAQEIARNVIAWTDKHLGIDLLEFRG